MLPALHSWREELPAHMVRLMAYVGGLVVLSIAAAQVFQSTPLKSPIAPVDRSGWTTIEKPFPAFTLAIPEAAGQPENYTIRRHTTGNGRQDIMALGTPDGATPYLRVEVYRAGSEISRFATTSDTIVEDAAALGPINVATAAEPVASKFGPLSLVTFETSQAPHRYCLGFARAYDDPLLQISGWFCQGDGFVRESTLACALDRLTLLYAGSEPKVGALFAQAELSRSYCGQRDPLLAATPKYHVLWKALEGQPPSSRALSG